MSKTCICCLKEQPLSGYHRDQTSKDGLKPKCKTCRKADSYTYYKSNTDDILAKRSEYRALNKDTLAKYQTEVRSSLTETNLTARHSVNLARSRSDLPSSILYGGLTYLEAISMTEPLVTLRFQKEQETGEPHQIDHIIPIKKGGTHTFENIQVLTASANRLKGDKVT